MKEHWTHWIIPVVVTVALIVEVGGCAYFVILGDREDAAYVRKFDCIRFSQNTDVEFVGTTPYSYPQAICTNGVIVGGNRALKSRRAYSAVDMQEIERRLSLL